MAEEPERTPFNRKIRRFLRTYRFLLSIVLLAIGILLTVLAVAAFTPLGSAGPFPTINNATNQGASGGPNYDLVFVIAGPIIVMVGSYLVGSYYIARARFEHLMVTKSKAEFLRNLPDLEDLLWDLTPDDEQRYLEKKAELRIRR
jgi:ABC-type phosphate transport system permease subunit